ncbi:28878_t:CDS:2 [Dentiscutata erythropus]|uniref:28878_t:CDS:1 n=1 Tax=Dentiscutata erythropus TaxID=1348616 RepID=A0A9N9FCU7_9GLOM|nr:28878_t:CDS:2 [Dentiscutata erythropus]
MRNIQTLSIDNIIIRTNSGSNRLLHHFIFTPAQYRHKGYATKLMKLLNHKLRFECKAKFSYLYSEVGSDFYSILGWRIFPHKEIKFDRFSMSLKHSELIVAINQSNLETIISYITTKPAFDWLFQKTNLYSKFYAVTNDQRQFGAMISNKKKESYNEKEELFERFIMWNHDFRGNKLFIIRFRCDSPYSTRLLIQQAIQEASKFQFKQIILWNPDLRLFNNSEGLNVFEVEISERTESLPYLSWYADNDDNVDWILIEKYSWF